MQETQTPRETISVAVPTVTGTAPASFRLLASPLSPRFVQNARETHSGRGACCAVCHAPLIAGDVVALVLSNQVLFPNCMTHQGCVAWDDLVGTAEHIRAEWRAAQQYAHWF